MRRRALSGLRVLHNVPLFAWLAGFLRFTLLTSLVLPTLAARFTRLPGLPRLSGLSGLPRLPKLSGVLACE